MSLENINQIVYSGIIPIEIEYHSIYSSQNSESIGFRTIMKINSPELGTLYPEQYRIVSNRTVQATKLSSIGLDKIIEDMQKFLHKYSENFFISVYIPIRMIEKDEIDKLLSSIDNKNNILSNLALEFTTDILLSGTKDFSDKLNNLKKEYGVKLILSDFGDEYCPVLRLKELPFDYVILDKSISTPEKLKDSNTHSVIQLINDNSMTCLVEGSNKPNFTETITELGIPYICSNRVTKPNGVE